MRAHLLLALAFIALTGACTGASGGEPAATTAQPAGAVTEPADDAPAATGMPATPAPTAVRQPTVVLDPGHGGAEVGAANAGVVEKESNLDMALRVERMLQAAGVRVVLTRRDDRRVGEQPAGGQPAGGFPATRFDLQARVDAANAEAADLFLSLHSNGSTDGAQRGVEVWYDPDRRFGSRNRRLAETVLAQVVAELGRYGYPALDRGIKDDSCFRSRFGRCFALFLLGPERTVRREEAIARGVAPEALGIAAGQDAITTRATQMPGALAELLFISNAADAAVLRDEGARDAIARGITRALLEMLDDEPAAGEG